MSPWNVAKYHLLAVMLKVHFAESEEEKAYFLKCVNPDNPFTEEPTTEMTWSKEHGCLIMEEIETTRTIFHMMKRSNRSVSCLLSDIFVFRNGRFFTYASHGVCQGITYGMKDDL